MLHISYIWYCSSIPGMPGIPDVENICRVDRSCQKPILYYKVRWIFLNLITRFQRANDWPAEKHTNLAIIPLPPVFCFRRNYLYQLNIGMNFPPRHELLVAWSRTFEFSTLGKLMHAGGQPAHNSEAHDLLTKQHWLQVRHLNQPRSREFTEMQSHLFINIIRLQQQHFIWFIYDVSLVWQQLTNKSIRALISLISHDYVRQ